MASTDASGLPAIGRLAGTPVGRKKRALRVSSHPGSESNFWRFTYSGRAVRALARETIVAVSPNRSESDVAARVGTTAAATRAESAAPLDFYCAEIWGGNRRVSEPFSLPGVRGYVYSQPCDGGRGGDIHYVSLCSAGLISRLCLADVAGHGAAISAVSGQIHTLLRRHMNTLDQRRVLRALNRRLVASDLTLMATAAVVSYFPPSQRVSVSYAGHPPVWRYDSRQGRWSMWSLPSPDADALADLPLAADATTRFSRDTIRVNLRDRLLVVTDGVLETQSPTGEEFGEVGLQRLLDRLDAQTPEALGAGVIDGLRRFADRPTLAHDDVSLMVLEFVQGPQGLGLWHGLKRKMFGRPHVRPDAGSQPS